MAAVSFSAQVVGSDDAWAPALEKGIEEGVEKVAEQVRDVAANAIRTRTDPWGAAFAPPSPLTIKLRARLVEDIGSLADAFILRKRSSRKVTLLMRGKQYPAGHVMQFGSESKHVFDNANTVSQPARPFLPIRGEEVDVPEELTETLTQVLNQSVSDALDNRFQSSRRGRRRASRRR